MDSSYCFPHKHIFGIEQMSKEDITFILDTALSFKEISERSIKKVPTLRGKTVVNLFLEPSTRTRVSFEVAGKRLSADTFNISGSTSSTTKGETLLDTARNLEAMNPDAIVLRHSSSGAAEMLSKHIDAPIVNAGDGTHEHPSQALLDMLTIRENFGSLEGLEIAIVGDVSHSRVALSNINGFQKMGAKVRIAGPATFIPPGIERLGVKVCASVDEAVTGANVIMALRIQKERQKEPLIPSNREYSICYGINKARVAKAADNVIIMHPGPVNRGVEMNPDVADGKGSVILDQVTNGVAVRMALLYLVAGSRNGEEQGEQ